MRGPWLIVKWAGIGILLSYLALLIFAIFRFRSRLVRMRLAYVPIVLGNFVSLSLPWIFMKAAVTRICFVLAQVIFIYGITVLVKDLARKEQLSLES